MSVRRFAEDRRWHNGVVIASCVIGGLFGAAFIWWCLWLCIGVCAGGQDSGGGYRVRGAHVSGTNGGGDGGGDGGGGGGGGCGGGGGD